VKFYFPDNFRSSLNIGGRWQISARLLCDFVMNGMSSYSAKEKRA